MKSKTRPKAKKKAYTRTKTRTKTHISAKAKPNSTAFPTPSPGFTPTPAIKTCEEVEVGDIGGFGSPEELEEHEKRCTEKATQVCSTCAKNLCNSHYDLLHRDHDGASGHLSGRSAIQQ